METWIHENMKIRKYNWLTHGIWSDRNPDIDYSKVAFASPESAWVGLGEHPDTGVVGGAAVVQETVRQCKS